MDEHVSIPNKDLAGGRIKNPDLSSLVGLNGIYSITLTEL